MKIKICGLTEEKEAAYVKKQKVDFAGMVLFFQKSRRNISIEQAKKLIAVLSDEIQTVAVVVQPDFEQVAQIEQAGFDYIQIHGELSEDLLQQIHIPVLKAFNINDMQHYEAFQKYPQIAGYVFDAQEPGSGKAFDWNLMKTIQRDGRLFLLAGGLHADNVRAAIDAVHPDGVDVSSGVEFDSGSGKDPQKIRQFVQEVRKYDDGLDFRTV